MANTYLAYLAAIPMSPGKTLVGIWNGHASDVVKVRKIFAFANTVTPFEFRETELVIRRCSSYSGGRELMTVKHDTTNPNLNSDIKPVTSGEWTDTSIITRKPVSMDDPAVGAATWPVFGEATPVLGVMWDFGLKSNLRPLTLRQNEGCRLMNFGASDQGEYDAGIEFTVE